MGYADTLRFRHIPFLCVAFLRGWGVCCWNALWNVIRELRVAVQASGRAQRDKNHSLRIVGNDRKRYNITIVIDSSIGLMGTMVVPPIDFEVLTVIDG
ncbi:hypothetical protein [Bifidobacterium sp. ESL0704]|uniref:hypothetical protein n=1 Tax=Bifidobacterium sp. ESL0704 TaxID=2983219 RepID=UPI0023FA36E7|nr:hypothetical protein [Bifidobacterium sp. ESL0704]WEV53329.1 hypothetical protein OZX64_02250 [Bifidobacterium sp. ESL0704]